MQAPGYPTPSRKGESDGGLHIEAPIARRRNLGSLGACRIFLAAPYKEFGVQNDQGRPLLFKAVSSLAKFNLIRNLKGKRDEVCF